MHVSELALRVERQRFRLEHRLGGDSGRLAKNLAALHERAPYHPIVQNERARICLPETWPGPPPLALARCAKALLDGRPDDALHEATRLASELPRDGHVQMALGDLQMLAREVASAEASYRRALEILGPMPCVMVRYGRCRLLRHDLAEAWSMVVGALSQNPAYGTALVLYRQVAKAGGRDLTPVPLPYPVRKTESSWEIAAGLTPPAEAAWHMYTAHRGGGLPPGFRRHRAMLKTWRQKRGLTEREGASLQVLPTLDHWDRMGMLRSYLWVIGLTSENASEYRGWFSERPDRMRSFWELGPTGHGDHLDQPRPSERSE